MYSSSSVFVEQMRNKCSFLFFMEEGKERTKEEVFAVVVEIQKKEKKRKRKDETNDKRASHSTLSTMENLLLFRVKFSSP